MLSPSLVSSRSICSDTVINIASFNPKDSSIASLHVPCMKYVIVDPEQFRVTVKVHNV